MNILILGGNSIQNREWVFSLAAALERTGASTIPYEYHHWKSGDDFIDIEYELTALQHSNLLTNEYILIAKSKGAVLALQGIHTGVLHPSRCVLLGLPLNVIHEHSIPVQSWLSLAAATATFIQNEHDPLGSYDAVQSYLIEAGVPEAHIIASPGDTHDYLDFATIIELSASLPANSEHH